MRTEEFKKALEEKEVVVFCDTKEKAIGFLKYLEGIGYKWNSGHYLSAFTNWGDYEEHTGYKLYKDKSVSYGNRNSLLSDSVGMVLNYDEASDLFKSDTELLFDIMVKISSDISQGGWTFTELTNIFGTHSFSEINEFGALKILELYRSWKEKENVSQTIEVGDIFKEPEDDTIYYVVTNILYDIYSVMYADGSVGELDEEDIKNDIKIGHKENLLDSIFN